MLFIGMTSSIAGYVIFAFNTTWTNCRLWIMGLWQLRKLSTTAVQFRLSKDLGTY